MPSQLSTHSRILYFNSANLSICPQPILDSINQHRKEFEQNPTLGLKTAWGKLWSSQKVLAQFLGAEPTDLILRSNVTEVLNTFILGHPLVEGDEILVGELEYGAIFNICRFRSLKDKLQLRTIKIPQSQVALAKLIPDKLARDITSQFSARTRMVVLSHVIASLGLKLPIEAIAQTTRAQNIALVVDGSYAVGSLAVDFGQLKNIDYYGSSLYKWLKGPKGTAFGWVHPSHQNALNPLMAGWTTFDSSGVFSDFGRGSRFQEKFKMLGCRDFAPFFAIQDLMDFWKRETPSKLREKMVRLNHFLQRRWTEEMGIVPISFSDPLLQAPMTVFRVPEKFQSKGESLSETLLSQLGVQINFTSLSTGWYGVVSSHIDNSEDEIEKLVLRLKTFFAPTG